MQIDLALERQDIAEAADVLRQHFLERFSVSRWVFAQSLLLASAAALTGFIGYFFPELRAGVAMILVMLGGAVCLHAFDSRIKGQIDQHIWAGMCRAGPRRIEIMEWDERLRVDLPDVRFSDIDEVFIRDGYLFVFAPCSIIFIPVSAVGEDDIQSLMERMRGRDGSTGDAHTSENQVI